MRNTETLEQAEKRIRKEKIEHAVVFSKNKKRYLGEATGTTDKVPLKTIEQHLKNGAVITHNHPLPRTVFSPEDLHILIEYDISEVRLVDKKYWYSAKKTRKSKPFTTEEFIEQVKKRIDEMPRNHIIETCKRNNAPEAKRLLHSEAIKKTLNDYNYKYSWGEW